MAETRIKYTKTKHGYKSDLYISPQGIIEAIINKDKVVVYVNKKEFYVSDKNINTRSAKNFIRSIFKKLGVSLFDEVRGK